MSERIKIQDKIEKRIDKFEYGTVFTPNDFIDISSNDKAGVALSRIYQKGKIRRIMQGIYDKPEYSNLIKEYASPRPDKVAETLARKFNWTIAPTGNTALNMLHLSTQVSNKWEYISNGPSRVYKFYNTNLEFHSSMQREISGFHKVTVMVIGALRCIGEKNIMPRDIKILKDVLTEEDKKIILEEGKTSTKWIYEIIKKISNGDNYD